MGKVRPGSGMVPFEKALVNFYRPSIVTLSLHVSEILPVLCSSTFHHLALFLVDQNLPYDPVAPLGGKSAYIFLIAYFITPIVFKPIVNI